MFRFKLAALTTALIPAFSHPAKETLHIQIGKDKHILDTVLIWIDYAKSPEVDPIQGGEWSDWEKDSVWIDEENHKIVRYTHNFLATKGTRKGFGNDYISFTTSGNSEPQYIASVSFNFQGDTAEAYTWEPVHWQDNPEIFPYQSGFKAGTGFYGQVTKYVGNGGDNLAQGQWALFLSRANGWVGSGGMGTTSLRQSTQVSQADRWFVHMVPGTVLRVPPGATRLKVLDVQGRVQWQTHVLPERSSVSMPEGLPPGAFRLYWVSEPS